LIDLHGDGTSFFISTQNIIHWAQMLKSGKFQRYDYGSVGNLKHYNSTTPPLYTLQALPSTLPVAIFYGDKDILADPADIQTLLQNLPHSPVFVKELKQYAHLDFCIYLILENIEELERRKRNLSEFSGLFAFFLLQAGVSLQIWTSTGTFVIFSQNWCEHSSLSKSLAQILVMLLFNNRI
jgi:hypothetical protein